MSAASGAACMTMKMGETSQSNQLLSPIQSPRAIPMKAEISRPITSGRSVSTYAWRSEPSIVMAASAAMDSRKVGNA